jgi:hypothetical protein
MSKAAISVFIGLGVFVLILLYDAYLFLSGGTEATISWLIYEASYEKPFMVFCIGNILGILEGHLFWQMKKPNEGEKR